MVEPVLAPDLSHTGLATNIEAISSTYMPHPTPMFYPNGSRRWDKGVLMHQ